MRIKYHAGSKYTNEQQDELDAAFQAWLDIDVVADYHGYEDKAARDKANASYQAYKALKVEFDAINEQPYEEPYMHGHPQNGY